MSNRKSLSERVGFVGARADCDQHEPGAASGRSCSAPLPVLVLEGFGRRPMTPAAYKLLSTNIKREVSLNAEMPLRRSPQA